MTKMKIRNHVHSDEEIIEAAYDALHRVTGMIYLMTDGGAMNGRNKLMTEAALQIARDIQAGLEEALRLEDDES